MSGPLFQFIVACKKIKNKTCQNRYFNVTIVTLNMSKAIIANTCKEK